MEVKQVMNRENPEDIIGVSEFLRTVDLLFNVTLNLVEIQSVFFEKNFMVISSPITI